MSVPVEIIINERGVGSVKLDGHEVAGAVRSLSLDVAPGPDGPHLTLRMRPSALTVKLPDAGVDIGEPMAELLAALGWTPPCESGVSS